MRKSSAIAFILMLAVPFPAAAYTQEDVQACTPDAVRLCQQALPDKDRVVLCLVKQRRQLSPACTLAFNRARSAIATAQQTKF
jgi:hypothetical protein